MKDRSFLLLHGFGLRMESGIRTFAVFYRHGDMGGFDSSDVATCSTALCSHELTSASLSGMKPENSLMAFLRP